MYHNKILLQLRGGSFMANDGYWLLLVVPAWNFIMSQVLADKDFNKDYKAGGLIVGIILMILIVVFNVILGG